MQNVKISDTIFQYIIPFSAVASSIVNVKNPDTMPKTTTLESAQAIYELEIQIQELFSNLKLLIEKDVNDTVAATKAFKDTDLSLGQLMKGIKK